MILRKIKLIIFLTLVVNNGFAQIKSHNIAKDSLKNLFDRQFRKLDSCVASTPLDTIFYCATPQIHFMERNTNIKSMSPYTSFGKLWFSKRDWEAWHKWYFDHYEK